MAERDRLFKRHPKTTFIAAHMGWHANDLARLGKMFDEMPNVYGEVGAVLYDLGRQPRTAHDFLVKYQDRVLFGKDSYQPDEFPYFWRDFETADEYFDYYRDYHAFWKLYGLGAARPGAAEAVLPECAEAGARPAAGRLPAVDVRQQSSRRHLPKIADMAHYLVTGGAGFIGSHLAEELVRRGERVRVVDSLITGKRENLAHLPAGRVHRGRPGRPRRRAARGRRASTTCCTRRRSRRCRARSRIRSRRTAPTSTRR